LWPVAALALRRLVEVFPVVVATLVCLPYWTGIMPYNNVRHKSVPVSD
jgi:hypothetical protein